MVLEKVDDPVGDPIVVGVGERAADGRIVAARMGGETGGEPIGCAAQCSSMTATYSPMASATPRWRSAGILTILVRGDACPREARRVREAASPESARDDDDFGAKRLRLGAYRLETPVQERRADLRRDHDGNRGHRSAPRACRIAGRAIGGATTRGRDVDAGVIIMRVPLRGCRGALFAPVRREWDEGFCPACRQARKDKLAKSRLADVPSPPFVILFINSLCNMNCEHCFYWKQLNQRDDLTLRRDRGAVGGAGPDREPESLRRRAVPAQGVRRDLPAVHPAQRRQGDLRPDATAGSPTRRSR